MKFNRKSRYIAGFLLLILCVVLFFCLNLLTGSSQMTLSKMLEVLTGNSSDTTAQNILLRIRLPRLSAAFLLGGALSVSGFLLQCFFGNPIAGPFVLGISSGAKLAVALVMVTALQIGISVSSWMMVLASFLGAMLSMGWILLISRKVRSMSLLIVSGVMLGYICSAVTELIVAFADDANIVNLHNWSMGSFSGTDWQDVRLMTSIILLCLLLTFLMSKPLNAYQLGEAYAENMGVNLKKFRITIILLSSILSACVTAFAGPVSFVGVAVPHLMKTLFGTAKPIIIIPASFLGGGVFCLGCDLLARNLFAPTELSISTVTAVFGAPVVIWIMLHRSMKNYE
ncbi:MAG: iron ABC transporter permease [Oscillospiraceae bacterium]|nr:iron ABC transporter permease [Oscillospiraceae bacterium]